MSSFLETIRSGVSLRKTNTKESKQVNTRVICSSDKDYENLLEETNFDTYFKAIEPFSFRSLNMPLEESEVEALVKENSKFKTFLLNDNEKDNIVEYDEWKVGECALVLNNLAEKIGNKIKEMEELSGRSGVFVRLSTLSPKDAAINRIGFVKLIHDEYLKILKESGLENDSELEKQEKSNMIMYALYRASISILKIENGHQAVQLLIESKRAQQEFKSMLESPSKSPLDLVVREWNDFDVSHEFRAFVYNRKITGITQYNPVVYFPNLCKQKDHIKQLMTSFIMENIVNNPLLPISNYAVDIILIRNNKTDELEVKIVELNPLAEFTGTVLFSWEEDRSQLMAESNLIDSECEFRMLDGCAKFAEVNCGPEWQNALKKLHQYFL